MLVFRVFDLFKKRALVTRESARELERALRRALKAGEAEVTLDFAGVDAVTPSFIDEALSVIEEVVDLRAPESRIVFIHSPTRLSAKFSAIARAHRAEIVEGESGEWTIRRVEESFRLT